MVPSLDDIQQVINRMIQLTLDVSRGVAHWGQQRVQKSPAPLESGVPRTSSVSAGKGGKKEESERIACGCFFFSEKKASLCKSHLKFQNISLKLSSVLKKRLTA